MSSSPGSRKCTEKLNADKALYVKGIARQQWRARIETAVVGVIAPKLLASPASNGGRGLKQ